VRFPKGGYYEIEGRYNNTLPVALDSMISVGMYFDDINFRRPDWSMPNSTAAYCGVTSDKSVIVPQSVSASPQLFDPIKDGPLLTKIKQVELDTTMGKLRLFIDPAKAPQTATQFYRLMVEGGFNGVSLINYQPSYLLQVDSVEHNKGKTEGKAKLVVRSLPVEAGSAVSPPARHKKLALSVARQGDDPFSGTSSFCIMLNSAPHLDGKYTVFGWVCDDRESLATLTEITKQWNSRKPVITSCRPI
jgi:cyclophilin family peptidyl-prolyl cis-trans isomerase